MFWLDAPDRPAPSDPLVGPAEADLAIVGGGYMGLWAALLAKQRDPDRDVLLIEADTIAAHASGRNGGFVDASITHGIANGAAHFPGELSRLVRLGHENFDSLAATIAEFGVDARFEANGMLAVATEPWQLDGLREAVPLLRDHGETVDWLERDELRVHVDSPTYLGGYLQRTHQATVDPARLAWGLADAARSVGVRIHEGVRAERLDASATGVRIQTDRGVARARRVVLATNALSHLVRATRRRVVPVWDYVVVTEPLSPAQRAAVGWSGGCGVGDAANQFHYSRVTPDGRILWGGYDAIYYFGGDVSDRRAQRDATFDLLARHFFETFPQLDGLRFTHRWGGVIDTSSRFCVTFGTAHAGRVSFAVGYTGLGVAATRFGAQVALDLVDNPQSELCRLDFVRSKPFPFPPEPLRFGAIDLTRRAIGRADRRAGRRGPWLRLLDRFGVGFDS